MYAARFDLANRVFPDLSVVLHFACARAADGSLALDHMRAYLRSRSM